MWVPVAVRRSANSYSQFTYFMNTSKLMNTTKLHRSENGVWNLGEFSVAQRNQHKAVARVFKRMRSTLHWPLLRISGARQVPVPARRGRTAVMIDWASRDPLWCSAGRCVLSIASCRNHDASGSALSAPQPRRNLEIRDTLRGISLCSSEGRPYEIRDTILTCARKPTWVSLIYRTEPTTKKCKNRGKN